MSSPRVYGSHVDVDGFSEALNETRVLRLALNVLYDNLPFGMVEGAVEDLFCKLHEQLAETEAEVLKRRGLAEYYVIVRPVSPVSPPGPEAMKEIAAAIRTLEGHGMLVQAPDVQDRD